MVVPNLTKFDGSAGVIRRAVLCTGLQHHAAMEISLRCVCVHDIYVIFLNFT